MNKVRNIVGVIAVCATAAFLTGCDDDHNSGGGDNNNNTGNAPATLNSKSYTLTDAGGTNTIAFDAANNYTITPGGGAVAENGTFTATKNGDIYNVILANAAGDTNSNSTLNMTFSSPTAGTYTLDRPGQAQANGNFVAESTTLPPPPPPPGDTNQPPAGGGTIPAPVTVPGQITFTTGAGGGIGAGTVYTTTFSGGTSGTFTSANQAGDALGSGTFEYTPQGNDAHLRMTYGGQFQGDYDDATLSFSQPAGSGQANTYTGTQSVSGTVYPFNGTFTY
jgi:hypothetical protein